jgi:hypothetical protein
MLIVEKMLGVSMHELVSSIQSRCTKTNKAIRAAARKSDAIRPDCAVPTPSGAVVPSAVTLKSARRWSALPRS